MPTIQYVTKTLAKQGIKVEADPTTKNRWNAEYRGYVMHFCCNVGESDICNMGVTRGTVKTLKIDGHTDYRDSLTRLLDLLNRLADSRDRQASIAAAERAAEQSAAPAAPAVVTPTTTAGIVSVEDLTPDTETASEGDDESTMPEAASSDPNAAMRERFPLRRPVIVVSGPFKGRRGVIAATNGIVGHKGGFSVGISLDTGDREMPYFSDFTAFRRIDPDAADAPRQSFRTVALDADNKAVHSACGWEWHPAFDNFLKSVEDLSGEVAASVVSVGIVTVFHFADGLTVEDEPTIIDHLFQGFREALEPRIAAYQAIRALLTEFAARPGYEAEARLQTAMQTYRDTFSQPAAAFAVAG